MAQQYPEISEKLKEFITKQKLFFVSTATEKSKVNISPKGMDSFKVINKNRVAWLNVTGSGNETSAHIQQNPRMTIMFASFEEKPMILRLYGKAKAIHKNDPEWENLISLFPQLPASRQIFYVYIDLVQTSCGMAVPFFNYVSERTQLNDLHRKIGDKRIEEYWKKNNQHSLDGIPTSIMNKNT
jgi:hypothetical protein